MNLLEQIPGVLSALVGEIERNQRPDYFHCVSQTIEGEILTIFAIPTILCLLFKSKYINLM